MRFEHLLSGLSVLTFTAGLVGGCGSDPSSAVGDGTDAASNGGAAGSSATGKSGSGTSGKGGKGGSGATGGKGAGGGSAAGTSGRGGASSGGANAGGAGGSGAGAGGASSGGATVDASAGGVAADAAPEAGKPCTTPLCAPRCSTCETAQCQDLLDGCYKLTGQAAAGPALGIDKASLCADVVTCVRAGNCTVLGGSPTAPSGVEACYCGDGVPFNTCASGTTVQGPCKDAIEAGAESTTASVVTARYLNPAYATGAAMQLILNCDQYTCHGPCYPGVDAGF